MNNSFRIELRDSYIHTGSWPQPGGTGYIISRRKIKIASKALLKVRDRDRRLYYSGSRLCRIEKPLLAGSVFEHTASRMLLSETGSFRNMR
jgi:hypothetical protein